ncbi:MAG: hypothetical protein ACR2KU_05535 [Gammaproteobacteria bacterium]
MLIRSHTDLCFFVVFAHILRNQIDDELLKAIMAIPTRDGGAFVADRLSARSRQIIFHENYHYWQGLRLPFLFRYAFLAFRTVLLAFKQLSRQNIDYHVWDCIIPELHRLDVKYRIAWAPGGIIYWGGSEAKLPKEGAVECSFSSIDLLESATSLAEFQYTTPARAVTDPSTFSRWAKRNPAYLAPFELTARFLGGVNRPDFSGGSVA